MSQDISKKACGNDVWNVAQYEKFKDQRGRPYYDLLAMIQPGGINQVVDLGCGTGELTAELHRRLGAAKTTGIDSSAAMLAESGKHKAPGLEFEQAEIERYEPKGQLDLVFSNAALQWVPEHEALLRRLTGFLAPGGQLAVQVPANHDHPSHRLAHEIAGSTPWKERLRGYRRESPVLTVERYAEILHRLGYREQRVRMEVYGHPMKSAADVVEWVKGTLLTDYQKMLSAKDFDQFVSEYRERLLDELGREGEYFYGFKRILFWARRVSP